MLISRVEFPLVRALREPTDMDSWHHRDNRIIKKARFAIEFLNLFRFLGDFQMSPFWLVLNVVNNVKF